MLQYWLLQNPILLQPFSKFYFYTNILGGMKDCLLIWSAENSGRLALVKLGQAKFNWPQTGYLGDKWPGSFPLASLCKCTTSNFFWNVWSMLNWAPLD